jgi:hypothetical protein
MITGRLEVLPARDSHLPFLPFAPAVVFFAVAFLAIVFLAVVFFAAVAFALAGALDEADLLLFTGFLAFGIRLTSFPVVSPPILHYSRWQVKVIGVRKPTEARIERASVDSSGLPGDRWSAPRRYLWRLPGLPVLLFGGLPGLPFGTGLPVDDTFVFARFLGLGIWRTSVLRVAACIVA